MTISGLFNEGLEHSAKATRQLFTVLFDGTEGVDTATDLAVSAGGGMSVDVAAGHAAIAGDINPDQGFYLLSSDAEENLAGITADGSNPRRVLVYAAVEDADEAGSGTDQYVIDYVLGTPAATPVDPSLPANALALARIAVPAAAASITGGMITDLRQLDGRARRPRGTINQKSVGATTGPIGGAGGLDVNGSDISFTGGVGRRLLYMAAVRMRTTVAGSGFDIIIERDGAQIGTTHTLWFPLADTDLTIEVFAKSLSTGSHTFNMHVERTIGSSGSGTVQTGTYVALEDTGGVI